MVIINSSCFIIIKFTTVHPTLLTCHPLNMYWMTQSLRTFQTINSKYRTALFHHLYQCLNLLLGSKIPTTGFFLFHLAKYTLLEFSIPINTRTIKAGASCDFFSGVISAWKLLSPWPSNAFFMIEY